MAYLEDGKVEINPGDTIEYTLTEDNVRFEAVYRYRVEKITDCLACPSPCINRKVARMSPINHHGVELTPVTYCMVDVEKRGILKVIHKAVRINKIGEV